MRFFFTIALFFGATTMWGNNIAVSNIQLGGNNDEITFDLSWENAWNTGTDSHDAAWVFVKFCRDNGEWWHTDLSATAADHSQTSPNLELETVPDGKGVFIKTAQILSGQTVSTTVTVKSTLGFWGNNLRIKVFAVEMVYITEGEFFLGDAVSQYSHRKGDAEEPFSITSEDPIEVGTGAGELYNLQDEHPPAGDILASYPKGFDGFYLMKHEISQAQYAGFLNCLTLDQQTERTATDPTSTEGTLAMVSVGNANRNTLVITTPSDGIEPAVYGFEANNNGTFNENSDGENRATNFLNFGDLMAYLDWAALRPITELEFEKACRGPENVVDGEFAWGTAIATDGNELANDGHTNETVLDTLPPGSGMCSHGYDGPQGPLRNGFAGTSTSNRLSIGASYYGALEMSGNLWELVVGLSAEGLNYSGKTGDGNVDASGNANVDGWSSTMGGYRGGGWNSGVFAVGNFRDLAVSDRFYVGLDATLRRNTSGGRGGR